MYSYEDRIRAVRLYIELGKRAGATIAQLGYPTKNALKSWHQKHEQHLDLPAGYVRSNSKYSDEQKTAAVDHFVNHGRCLAGTSRALGYPCRDTLAAWVEELRPDTKVRVVGRATGVPRSPAFKQAAVIELCTRQVSAQAIAQKLGATRPTLYKWKNQLLGREAAASMNRNDELPPDPARTALEQQVESLRRDIHRLQLEHDLLKKANELVKKDLGVDLQLLSNREKTLLVDALKKTYECAELLSKLDLARSSYFYHRARLRLADKYAGARSAMAEIFELNHRCYGYRRMRASLRTQQVFISEKVVKRLMKQECLVAATAKRRRYGSYLGEISPAPENLINRDFKATEPNE
jgi:putative transposase